MRIHVLHRNTALRCLLLNTRLQSREQPFAEASIPILSDVLVSDTVEVFKDDDRVLELGRVLNGLRRGFLDFVFDGVLPPTPHEVV